LPSAFVLQLGNCVGRLEGGYGQQRHEGLPKAIIDRAWDAQLRLCRRYRELVARGKNANIAVVAVARELAGFIWDIARLAMVLALPRSAQST
jgi:transposase